MSDLENKQRITRLTRKEKLVAISGGVLDDDIDRDVIRQRLEKEGSKVADADKIIERLAHEIAYIRLYRKSEENRLEPNEIAKQAVQTAAAIEECLTRLHHMHPHLLVVLDDFYWQKAGIFAPQVFDSLEPDLLRMQALLERASKEILQSKPRTGPRRSQWLIARDELAKNIREHSKFSQKDARALAEGLLALGGEPSTRKKKIPPASRPN